MPRIIEEVSIKLSWEDLDAMVVHERPKHVRQPGTHVSQVINWIASPSGLGLVKEYDDTDEMPLGVLLGMAFEEMCARLYPSMNWQPEPLTLDGLIGSPDGFDEIEFAWEEGVRWPIVDEFKRTLKSRFNHGHVIDNWQWMAQIAAYMHLDPRKPQIARLHVDWDAGDYRPPRAEYWRYLIRFERSEIEANWRTIVKYKGMVRPEGGAR